MASTNFPQIMPMRLIQRIVLGKASSKIESSNASRSFKSEKVQFYANWQTLKRKKHDFMYNFIPRQKLQEEHENCGKKMHEMIHTQSLHDMEFFFVVLESKYAVTKSQFTDHHDVQQNLQLFPSTQNFIFY